MGLCLLCPKDNAAPIYFNRSENAETKIKLIKAYMDKYLTMFSEHLDAAFKPEILFPDKKVRFKEWIQRKFSAVKHIVKNNKRRRSITNNTLETELVL